MLPVTLIKKEHRRTLALVEPLAFQDRLGGYCHRYRSRVFYRETELDWQQFPMPFCGYRFGHHKNESGDDLLRQPGDLW